MIEMNIKEWKFVGLLCLLVIVITFLPNFVGLIVAPQDSIFLGIQTMNSGDTPVYYSWIEQAKEGHFLFKNLFTPENEPRFIFDPFWLSVGLFAKIFSLSSFVAYQLARLFLIPIFLALAYIFISYFFEDERRRRICFIFLIFASGVGGFFSAIASLEFFKIRLFPMDLWIPEAITFYTLYHSPHFIASLSLVILILLLTLQSFEKQKIIFSSLAGIAALFLFQFHPYYAPVIFSVLGAYIIILSLRSSKIRWDLVKHYLILLLISSPAIFYRLWALKNFWTEQQHALQNNLLTPPFYNFLLTYGFLLILSCFGIVYLWKKRFEADKNIFLITWLVIQTILIYIPINFQRKMIEGLHMVIVITAIFGLFYLKKLAEKKYFFKKTFLKNTPILILSFILFFTFSNYYVLARDINFYLDLHPAAFLKKEKEKAMTWIRFNTPEESIIFSTCLNGNLIPAFAVRAIYCGQWGMTADLKTKLEQTQRFFELYGEKPRAAFLRVNQINYLFYGPEEKEFKNFNPEMVDYLEKVYQNEEAAIYKLKI